MPSKMLRGKAAIQFYAGVWPPATPLGLQAMWVTLRLDGDEIDSPYLSEDEDFGEGGGPVSDAWLEIHDRLRALDPDSVEAATAVYHCWRTDDRDGMGDEWDASKVERARKLTLYKLPRPY